LDDPTAPPLYPLSLHDALPISAQSTAETFNITVTELNTAPVLAAIGNKSVTEGSTLSFTISATDSDLPAQTLANSMDLGAPAGADRKSTRLNSSHVAISYAVFC